jgi:hypothetical protein
MEKHVPDSVMDDASIAQVAASKLPISLTAIEEIIREEDSTRRITGGLNGPVARLV